MPRWINFSSNSEVVELQVFADGFSVVYGTAAYIKVMYRNSTSCGLSIGKSKLAPMKNKLVTMLQLELLAALMALIICEIQKPILGHTLCNDATKFK